MNLLIYLCFSLTPFSADKVEIIKENGMSIVHLIGNVVIEDEETRIECEDALLYEEEDYVILNQDVVITEKEGSISADRARYCFDDNKGYLGGSVRLVSGAQVICADSLFYDGAEEHVEMHRNVMIEDTENNMIGYGGMGWYDLHDEVGHLLEFPYLNLLREDKDPIYIKAMKFVLHTEEDMFYGYDSVCMLIDSVTLKCDTFTYDLVFDEGAVVNPDVFEKQNTLQGERGQFSMKGDQVEAFRVFNGTSEYHSEEGNINNVEGDTITIMFENGQAVQIVIEGNPQGVLRLKRGSSDVKD
jgi:lipopolysaccharide export system protein LptA